MMKPSLSRNGRIFTIREPLDNRIETVAILGHL